MEQNNFDIKKVKVHRTTEATVLEIVFVLMAIIVWGLIITSCPPISMPQASRMHTVRLRESPFPVYS